MLFLSLAWALAPTGSTTGLTGGSLRGPLGLETLAANGSRSSDRSGVGSSEAMIVRPAAKTPPARVAVEVAAEDGGARARPASARETVAEDEAVGDASLATLTVVARTEEGAPIAPAFVDIVAPFTRRYALGASAERALALPPGDYRLLLARHPSTPAIPRYPPEGRSKAEVTLRAGERARVELIGYRGASLACEFVDSAGAPIDVTAFRSLRFAGARWLPAVARPASLAGRRRIDGLTAGRYLVAPAPGPAAWFEPVEVELGADQQREVRLLVPSDVPVLVRARVVGAGDGAPLPVQALARIEHALATRLPDGRDRYRVEGLVPLAGELELTVQAGEHRLSAFVPISAPGCTQILGARAVASRSLQLEAGREPEPAEFELALASSGPFAEIDGRIRTRAGEALPELIVEARDPRGRPERARLLPDADGRFRLVVDLDFVSDDRLWIRGRSGGPERILSVQRLRAGPQSWDIVTPLD